jgi:hypothetical protein
MKIVKNCVYNGKRIKIIDTRVTVSKDNNLEKVFVDDVFYLAIWDKSLCMDVGGAKQLEDGTYVGYVPHGMHQLAISGATIRILARDAYAQYSWSLNH